MSISNFNKPLFLCLIFLLSGQITFAQTQDVLNIVQKHLEENKQELKLTTADLENYKVSDSYVSKHNGVTHTYLIQRHNEIEVYNGMININVLPTGKVLNLGNRFISDLQHQVNTSTPQITAKKAVEKVISHFNVATEIPFVLAEAERINDQEIIFEHLGIALEPIKTKLVFQPISKTDVRLAWQVTLYERSANDWWNARIDAVTGEVLTFDNHVIKCSFGSSEEVCHEEHNHVHNTVKTTAVVDDVNNAYRVFPLYVESPIHGSDVLVVAPANATASPFGWHDTNGAIGEEYTITRGNNVHAYQDIFDQNFSIGDEPDGGDSLIFDFPFDSETDSPYTQVETATTNLFYWNNLIHDVCYQYGFDEVSGNFQENNYGNGGEDGDYVQAECLDGSGRNNANFGTPPDGGRPRMQMYFWGTGQVPDINPLALEITAPEAAIGTYFMVPANFGAELPSSDMPITGNLVLVNDGTDVTSDACEDLLNTTEIDGNIALIDRGNCIFSTKALAVQNAGATAVVICNTVAGEEPFIMPPGTVGSQINIPVVMIGLEDCNILKMNALGLTASLYDIDFSVPLPGPTGVDGDFDNGIICHEYGHGVSNRLTGGPSQAGCLNNPEQMGEGWSDFLGLVMTTSPANNADEGRGIGTYASEEATDGPGIRTYRYSRDMTVNPHTYRNINGESIPHGVGSVWCVMLWDLYWNLVDEYGHDEDIYNGTGGNNIAIQLVLDGMKLQPCQPDFISGRDAIIAADEANYEGANYCIIWNTFARRGLGVSADVGGNENFDVPLECTNTINIDKVGETIVDAGSSIEYTLEIGNGLPTDVETLTITDVLPENTSYIEGSSTCPVEEDNGVLTFSLENVPSFVVTSCSYSVQIESGEYTAIAFEDDFEGDLTKWEIAGTGNSPWSISTDNPYDGSQSIFIPNTSQQNNQSILFAESVPLSSGSPKLSFVHRYNTEKFNDGGVIELRISGTWLDIGGRIEGEGYNSLIIDDEDNPLAGKRAFNGDSEGYIETILDLSLYAGLTVDIRFRFASNSSGSGEGWQIDNVKLFDDVVSVENTACLENEDNEEVCSTLSTIVYGIASSTENISTDDPRVSLFPNPTSNQFRVEVTTETSENAILNIYTTDGKLVATNQFSTSESFNASMAKYGAGLYFIEVITSELQTVKKLIVR